MRVRKNDTGQKPAAPEKAAEMADDPIIDIAPSAFSDDEK